MDHRCCGVPRFAGEKNFLDDGHDVVPVDDFYALKVEEIDGKAIRNEDVRNASMIEDQFSDVDALSHLAALTGVQECARNQDTAFDVNVGATENVA